MQKLKLFSILIICGLSRVSGQYYGYRRKVITCDKPVCPSNGYITPIKAVYKVGDKITYGCNAGYAGYGDTTVTCMDNGEWSGPPLVCKRSTQSEEIVDYLANQMIESGKLLRSLSLYENEGQIGHLNQAEHPCNTTQRETKCTGGKIWTNPGKCCEPTCSEPVCIAQADCEPACQCPDGMLLDDRPGEDQCFTPDECPEPKCTGGKVWTNPGKCCEPTCSEPVCIAQADCEPVCQCPDGMLLDDRLGEDQCFTPDECPAVTCHQPDEPEYGIIFPMLPEYNIDDVVDLSCDNGYVQTGGPAVITCLKTGVFSSSTFACKAVTCQQPDAPEYGSISPMFPEYSINASVYLSCDNGYDPTGEPGVLTCLKTGVFSPSTFACIHCDLPWLCE